MFDRNKPSSSPDIRVTDLINQEKKKKSDSSMWNLSKVKGKRFFCSSNRHIQHTGCIVNMVTMFKRGILADGYAFCILLNTMTVFSLCFSSVTCYYSEETMEACRAAQSASRLGLIRGRCGSQNTDYVLFINAVLNRFFSLGRIFFRFSLKYTQALILTHTTNKEHLVPSYEGPCLLERVAQGHGLWHQYSRDEW